jgi:hypothetical protein
MFRLLPVNGHAINERSGKIIFNLTKGKEKNMYKVWRS